MIFQTTSPQFVTFEKDKIIYPFSPPLFQCNVDLKYCKFLIEEGRKLDLEKNDFRERLAGVMKKGTSLNYSQSFIENQENFLKSIVERFLNGIIEQYGPTGEVLVKKLLDKYNLEQKQYITGKLKLDKMWINFQKSNDYNPIHTHSGILSFVIFCKVPNEIFEIQPISNNKRAGEIVFDYGECFSKLLINEFSVKPYEGLMFVFPAELRHQVPPFYTDCERISVSGNFVVI